VLGTRPAAAVKTDGRAATLEEAKAEFAASWEAFKTVGRDSDSMQR
jgi:hypothetical protein